MPNPESEPYRRLAALGLVLPAAPQPVASYTPAVRSGNLLFLSGQGPSHDGVKRRGKVGGEVSAEQAYEHARFVGINLLAVIHEVVGLDRVNRVVKLLGLVNAVPDFTQHPQVVNGCSNLLIEVFGEEKGKHARSAMGAGSLPALITAEIEMIVELSN